MITRMQKPRRCQRRTAYFQKTFATKMYENGARVEEIAAYIGDLPSTTQKYYIAIRRKVVADGETHQIVKLPGSKAGEEPVA